MFSSSEGLVWLLELREEVEEVVEGEGWLPPPPFCVGGGRGGGKEGGKEGGEVE